jgi:hypothetical protein
LLVIVAWLLPSNMALFTVFSGLLTAFSGSFFTRINPKEKEPNVP